MESPVPFNAFFNVVTVPMVAIWNDPMGKGYSWGIITIKRSDTVYRLYFATPEERNNVTSLQRIPAATLDRNVGGEYLDLSVDDPLVKDIYFLRNPENPWTQKVHIPSDMSGKLDYYVDDIIYYLRRVVSGKHNDPTVYVIPPEVELRSQVRMFKETQKKKVL